MHLHYFQHVPFEGPGSIEYWANSGNHTLTSTRWYLSELPPDYREIDLLIIMGGPMSIHDTTEYPWLEAEKEYIHQVINAGKAVVGICLGAQLIAGVLGAKITPNKYREIGWFPVTRSNKLTNTGICKIIPEQMEVFHWHGETFTLPSGCELIASTRICRNQGFIYKDRVIGLQFHLEMTFNSAADLIDSCGDEIKAEKYIQPAEEMLSEPEKFRNANRIMDSILDYLLAINI